MDKYFIGWSGNQELAKELARKIEQHTKDSAIVGGGVFEDMYVGAQVIKQMQQCSCAILLVEDKGEGAISANLMFEWGYLIARLPVNNIYTFLLNKLSRDLPSDLLGSWAVELEVDRATQTDEEIAQIIFSFLAEKINTHREVNYFDLFNNWRKLSPKLTSGQAIPDTEFCRYLATGCLAAYYYMDYRPLRKDLDSITPNEECADIVAFSKGYIDLFLESNNMMNGIPESSLFNYIQQCNTTLARKRKVAEDVEDLVDILCYNVHGLACSLYLRNPDLDEATVNVCSQKARECFEKMLELVAAFEEKHENNECLIQLLRAYIYNDTAHLYRGALNDHERFMDYLAKSVEERKALYRNFAKYYKNPYLEIKLEQEYIIALSEQCKYLSDSFEKTMSQSMIRTKVKEWERELQFTSSLTERIKANVEAF